MAKLFVAQLFSAIMIGLLALHSSFAQFQALDATPNGEVAMKKMAYDPARREHAPSVFEDRALWRGISLQRQLVWSPKWIRLKRYKDVTDLREALDRAHIKLGLYAKDILKSTAFTLSTTAESEVTLIVTSVADLGFGSQGASLGAIHTRARSLGLELCIPEIGPQLRLQYLNQPVGDWLHIGMTPLANEQGALVDFTVANGGAGLMLLGGDAHPDLLMPPVIKFVFVLR